MAVSPTPASWSWIRLEEASLGVYDCPHSTPVLAADGPYLARTQDVGAGVFRLEGAARVSRATYDERVARAVPTYGDLLYSREGTYFGAAAEVPSGVEVCLGQRMVLIRPDPGVLNHTFARYWLNSEPMRAYVDAHKDGSVAQRLNLPIIRGIPVPLPSLKEQRAIASTLGALDDKIESNRRAIDLAEALGDSLFAQAASATTVLGDAARLTMGSSPPGSSYNEDGIGLPFYQGVRDFGRRFPGLRVWTTEPVRLAEANDTLVSVRAPVGDLNRASVVCCIGRGVASVRSEMASTIYYALRAASNLWAPFQQEGTVFGAINRADLAAAKLPWPAGSAASDLETRLSALDERIASLSRESSQLVRLREALLPELMSGRTRVPVGADAYEVPDELEHA